MTEWIAVCEEEGSDPIEIETEEDGTLLLENLVANFPGTTTLKYRNPGSNAFRALKCAGGVLKGPGGGWDQVSLYICVNPSKPETATPKRRAEPEDYPASEKKRTAPVSKVPELDPLATIDLILLGLKPTTTEEDIRLKMEEYGPVTMVQMKKGKDVNVRYAFVRFKDKEAERKALKEKHMIDGNECVMRVPDSQQGGDKALRKIYISYHSNSLKKEDFMEHFDKFGDVVEIFIPEPWRHFAFVTFTEQRVAAALIGKEHTVKGVSLLIKSAANLRGKKDDRQEEFGGAMGMGMGQMGGMMGGPMGGGQMGMGQMGGQMGGPMSGQMGGPMGQQMGGFGGIGVPPPTFGNSGMMGQFSGMGQGGSMGSMSGMMDNNKPSGLPWAGANNYGYGQPQQQSSMMDRKASMPRSSRFGI